MLRLQEPTIFNQGTSPAAGDALMMKVGVVKAYWEAKEDVNKESYKNLTEDELALLLSDPAIEVVSQNVEFIDGGVDPMGFPIQIPLYSVKVKKVKKYPDGSLVKFTGEQRRETEKFIKTSIGSYDDFLMTILTTGTNLEDLLEAKPTARGQVLSRFLGLDFLKRKEETGKEIYSEFSRGMISNIYNTESLKTQNEELEMLIKASESSIKDGELKVLDVQGRLQKGQEYRDNLLSQKVTVERELTLLNPDQTKKEIDGFESQIKQNVSLRDGVKIVEPSEFYKETEHDKVKEEYQRAYKEKVEIDTNITYNRHYNTYKHRYVSYDAKRKMHLC